jgi:rfaE bifunctional protein nucleotidyltransferase chain/domain
MTRAQAPAALPRNLKLALPAELLPILEAARASGKSIVFTNGCYDLLHSGHVDFLARCKALGDILILGLNSDASVRRQGKLPPRPVTPFADRAFVLAHLASVDYIVGFDEDTPLELIKAIKPQLLVKGGDWPVERIAGRAEVEQLGGRVLSLPLLPGYSTTGILDKLKRL